VAGGSSHRASDRQYARVRVGAETADEIDAMTQQDANEDLAAWLTRVERNQTHPNMRPKDAATLILLDNTASTPKVLLGRRHARHAFLPGKFVFPGGRIDRADFAAPMAYPPDPQMEERLMRGMQPPSAARARALAAAAIREAFEETGLLLGRRQRNVTASGPWRAFAEAGVMPDFSCLRYVARAITPPGRPRRFDTRFFTADAQAIAHRIDDIVGPDTELIELVWMPLAQARELEMPTVTKVMLIELEARIAAGMDHDLPVPFYRMLRKQFVREML
jgi:8-oxo-dGTP pyrophosphatase MutT (NUDIX family)